MQQQQQHCPEGFDCVNPNCVFIHRNGRRIEQTWAQAQQQQQQAYGQAQAFPQQAYISQGQYVLQQSYIPQTSQQSHTNYPSTAYQQQSQQQNMYYYSSGQQASSQYQYDQSVEQYYHYDEYDYPYMTGEQQQQYYQQYQPQTHQQPVKECRYGVDCRRVDCHFRHPQGRRIDQTETKSAVSELASTLATASISSPEEDVDIPDFEDESEPACPCCLDNPFECKNAQCSLQGLCNCMLKNFQDDDDAVPEDYFEEEGEESWKDEWFPSSASCPCCHGYIFKCAQQSEVCSKGKCSCSGAPMPPFPTENKSNEESQPKTEAQEQPRSWSNVVTASAQDHQDQQAQPAQ